MMENGSMGSEMDTGNMCGKMAMSTQEIGWPVQSMVAVFSFGQMAIGILY